MPESTTTPEGSQLSDLTQKYSLVRKLGQGANDVAYLVKNDRGKQFVMLTPISSNDNNAWAKTQHKLDKVEDLQKIPGLDQYLIHEVDKGIYQTENGNDSYGKPIKPHHVILTEYAGTPILEASNEEDKLQIMKHIWNCLNILHQANIEVRDFKSDHWLYTKLPGGRIVVKLIDYTQLHQLNASSKADIDNRRLDITSFLGTVYSMFSWYLPPKIRKSIQTYQEYHQIAEEILSDLENKTRELTNFQKAIMKLKRLAEERSGKF